MNIDFLSPMMIRETKKLVLLNFNEGKVYEPKLVENSFVLVQLDDEFSSSCFEDLESHRKEIEPEIPMDQIINVLNTEKDLSQQNEKHIFRRDTE